MRKESTVTVPLEGRDRGKVFRIREMSASQAESWGSRLLLALARSGVQLPEGIDALGMAGVAALGVRALSGVGWDEAAPLLAEMFACIQIVPDAAHPTVIRGLIEDDVEEVSTRFWLRDQVILLHTGFSFAAYASRLTELRKAAEDSGRNTATSQVASAPSSPAA